MEDEDLNQPGGEPGGGEGKQPAGGGKAPEKIELTRAEFEAIKRERDEARQSEQFWAKQARAGSRPQQTDVDEPEEELVETGDLVPEVTGDTGVDEAIFNDPDKWAEAIAKGPAAIQAFIKKAGYITGKDAADIAAKVARRTVQVERQKMGSDAAIIRDFPDLADPKSELYKATAAEVNRMNALDPNARRVPAVTLYAAAQVAKAKLDARAGGSRSRNERDPEDDDHYERYDRRGGGGDEERDRRLRAASQDATRRRGGDPDDDNAPLDADAREVARQMGVSEADYLKEAKAMRGSGAGRRR